MIVVILLALAGVAAAVAVASAVFTDIHTDAENEAIMMRHVDENGIWIDGDGWCWMQFSELKGHKVRFREVCVTVNIGGVPTTKTMIVLGSEPY